jgi:hypothetical protein
MNKGPFKLCLEPSCDGSSARLHLCGFVSKPIPANELGRWIRQLLSWADAPVELVLPAAEATGGWFESCTEALEHLPRIDYQIQFQLQS